MDQSRIERAFTTIHLVYHRNKNQHGKTAWWKWLSILRRSLLKLRLLHSAAAPRNEKNEKNEKNKKRQIMHISKYVHIHVIPKAYVYVLFMSFLRFVSNLIRILYMQCILDCRRRWPVLYTRYRSLGRARADEENHPSTATATTKAARDKSVASTIHHGEDK
jgi:hypothetical protein